MEHAKQVDIAPATQSSRTGASRKLLTRKAVEPSSAPPLAPTQTPPAPEVWSSEDEAALQALLARRRAAGYQQRDKDLSTQLLKPGSIKPNPDTIVATIVALVTERG